MVDYNSEVLVFADNVETGVFSSVLLQKFVPTVDVDVDVFGTKYYILRFSRQKYCILEH